MQQQMVPCPRCGAPLRVGERFCGNCGTGLSWPSQQQQMPPYQPPQPPPYQPPPQNQQWQAPPPQYQGYQQPQGWGQPPPPPGWMPPQQPPNWGGPQYGQQQRFYGPPPGKGSSSNLILILSVVLVIILAVGGVGIATKGTFKFGSKTTDSSPSSSTTTSQNGSSSSETTTSSGSTSTSTPVTVDELITAYSTDAEAAGATYKGKTITVSGKVAGVNATDFSVTLVGDSTADSGDVTCVFGSTDSSTISNLELDQAIKAKGTVGDFAGGSVELTNCSFVN